MNAALLTPDGVLRFRGENFRAAFGAGGIRADKREGDGATPAGSLPLRRVLYRADRMARPACAVPAEPIAPADGWCDDAGNPAYNRMVTLPFGGRHEVLWRNDALYDVIGVLGWNDTPPVPGLGSAIFLHVARPDYAPTEGCVALALGDITWVLAAGCDAIEVRA
ncbi:MAG TPA: L,D-transpeptidase family protein [Acetobacteraceae bacterium]|nr:L,D-transpeptidase family protein [Acetobacteraceae bacterium]